MRRRIGLLTGGGDAPGLNGIIESCVRALHQFKNPGIEVVGIMDGFEGIFGLNTKILNPDGSSLVMIEGLHSQAGTCLGTTNKCQIAGREKEFLENYQKLNLDGLLAAGGDGTFDGLKKVSSHVKLIGLPKTIDNDLSGTDITFGFDTACSVVAESVDALRATAQAHRRIIIVETMGRTSGWIALGGGLASYADVILIPERPYQRKALLQFIKEKQADHRGLLVVASEGAMAEGEDPTVAFHVAASPQSERYGGIAQSLARWFEKETGWESRHVVLGHLQRAKSPTTTDRFLTMAMGLQAAELVRQNQWDKAVVYRGGQVTSAPIQDVMQPARLVNHDHRWVKMAQGLNIFI